MITSQRPELLSKINVHYATWTRLWLSKALRQLHSLPTFEVVKTPDPLDGKNQLCRAKAFTAHQDIRTIVLRYRDFS
jgi:hypothetical protein